MKTLCHPKDLAAAKRRLSESIDLIPVTLNDAWLRDIGPTFVFEDEALIAIDWQFNGWGQNTEFEWDYDDAIARQIAEIREATQTWLEGTFDEFEVLDVDQSNVRIRVTGPAEATCRR